MSKSKGFLDKVSIEISMQLKGLKVFSVDFQPKIRFDLRKLIEAIRKREK